MLEEEEEAHTEVEEATLQAQVEGAAIKIQVKVQAKIKHKVIGMINLKFNVIIVRSMVIMQMNVERIKLTLADKIQTIILRSLKNIYSLQVMLLKSYLMMFGL